MKTIPHAIFRLFIFLFVLSGSSSLSAFSSPSKKGDSCQLKYGWADWAPLQYVNSTGQLTGVQIEFVKAVTQAVGCDIKFVKLSWSEVVKQIETGEIDYTANATEDDFRRQFAYFSLPYRRDTFSFWVDRNKKEEFNRPSVSAIMRTGAKLGLISNQLYSPEIEGWIANETYSKNIVWAEEIDDLLNLLIENQVDIAVEDAYIIAYRKRIGIFSNNFVHMGVNTFGYETSFMFSKKSVSKDLVEKFNKRMRELKNTPLFQSIWMNPELIK